MPYFRRVYEWLYRRDCGWICRRSTRGRTCRRRCERSSWAVVSSALRAFLLVLGACAGLSSERGRLCRRYMDGIVIDTVGEFVVGMWYGFLCGYVSYFIFGAYQVIQNQGVDSSVRT